MSRQMNDSWSLLNIVSCSQFKKQNQKKQNVVQVKWVKIVQMCYHMRISSLDLLSLPSSM